MRFGVRAAYTPSAGYWVELWRAGTTSVKDVREDRVFLTRIDQDGIVKGNKVHFLAEVVQGQEPGQASTILGTVK
jgi:hypothetical protein